MTENEMVGWHHQLDGHEFEQAPGVGVGQGSLACCSLWGCKELDMTERLCTHTLINKMDTLLQISLYLSYSDIKIINKIKSYSDIKINY